MRFSTYTFILLGILNLILLTEAGRRAVDNIYLTAKHDKDDQIDQIIQELSKDDRFKDLIKDILDKLNSGKNKQMEDSAEEDVNSENDRDNGKYNDDNNNGKGDNTKGDDRDCVATLNSDEEIGGVVCEIEIVKTDDGKETRSRRCKEMKKKGKKCGPDSRRFKFGKTSASRMLSFT